MRSLNTNIKIDFIRKEKSASGSVSSTEGRTVAESRDVSRKRPNSDDLSSEGRSVSQTEKESGDKTDNEGSPKKRRSRPSSRTFTFSRGDSSPKKKEKTERSKSRGRSRSRNRASEEEEEDERPKGRNRSFSFSRAPKGAMPEDFVSYLRKTQRPEDVEVGRLQKLRQLLRNETVVWVDAFINQGGMTEIDALLNRILKVEWRCVYAKGHCLPYWLTFGTERNTKTHSYTKRFYVSRPCAQLQSLWISWQRRHQRYSQPFSACCSMSNGKDQASLQPATWL